MSFHVAEDDQKLFKVAIGEGNLLLHVLMVDYIEIVFIEYAIMYHKALDLYTPLESCQHMILTLMHWMGRFIHAVVLMVLWLFGILKCN